MKNVADLIEINGIMIMSNQNGTVKVCDHNLLKIRNEESVLINLDMNGLIKTIFLDGDDVTLGVNIGKTGQITKWQK